MRPSGASSNAVGLVSAFVILVSENPVGKVAALETSAATLTRKTSSAIAMADVQSCRDFILGLSKRLPIIESSHPLCIKGSCTVLLIHEHARRHTQRAS